MPRLLSGIRTENTEHRTQNMRIISGRLARRKLVSPKGYLTRPTMSQTRESLFHLVESRMSLHDADVLDLFAGTGALGFEAISRGAASVSFVENTSKVLQYARKNAEDLDVEEYCGFIRADAVSYLERYSGRPFDLILADPPYDLPAISRLPDLALRHVKPEGLFVLEHDRRLSFNDHPALDTSRPYGRTFVSIFRPRIEAPESTEPEMQSTEQR
ncbi:MAG: RsmD family RNA methyltransferase, partial [Rhodothermales bacterium]